MDGEEAVMKIPQRSLLRRFPSLAAFGACLSVLAACGGSGESVLNFGATGYLYVASAGPSQGGLPGPGAVYQYRVDAIYTR
jgi:hypothetical protein